MSPEFMPFRIREHSGDLRITACGRDKMEALANAAAALLSQIVDPVTIEETGLRTVLVEQEIEEDRFIAFLNELIYLIDAQAWIPAKIKRLTTCNQSGCDRIEAVLSGEPIDPARHSFKYDIKAVTYHDFAVTRKNDLVEIHFLCDL